MAWLPLLGKERPRVFFILARETPSARAGAKPRLIESLRTLLERKEHQTRKYWKSLGFQSFLQREVLPPGPGVVTTQSGGGYHLSRGG